MAPDELYLLDLKNGDHQAEWILVQVKGNTPGRRYGHSLVYYKPYLDKDMKNKDIHNPAKAT